jgi:hypothetical protein
MGRLILAMPSPSSPLPTPPSDEQQFQAASGEAARYFGVNSAEVVRRLPVTSDDPSILTRGVQLVMIALHRAILDQARAHLTFYEDVGS